MPVLNLTRQTWLATTVRKADNFSTRLVGLLRRRTLGAEEALWLIPCKGIHTIGMKFPIDVIFLDHTSKVLDIMCGLLPYRLSRFRLAAHSVLELPQGTIKKSCTAPGDQLEILLAESSHLDDLKETPFGKLG
jgi:uncharacterized protein